MTTSRCSPHAAESADLAAQVPDADGVVYVPHLLGEGTPGWDLGARGTLVGLTRGTDRRHLCRAVLQGVADAGVDLVEAAEADTGVTLRTLRVDGGMSANPVFVQALADASGPTGRGVARARGDRRRGGPRRRARGWLVPHARGGRGPLASGPRGGADLERRPPWRAPGALEGGAGAGRRAGIPS